MEPQVEKKDKLSREIKGMVLGAAGLFLLIALASFNVEDLSFNSYSSETKVHNYGGFIGAQLADLLLQIFGLAGYLVPLAAPPGGSGGEALVVAAFERAMRAGRCEDFVRRAP